MGPTTAACSPESTCPRPTRLISSITSTCCTIPTATRLTIRLTGFFWASLIGSFCDREHGPVIPVCVECPPPPSSGLCWCSTKSTRSTGRTGSRSASPSASSAGPCWSSASCMIVLPGPGLHRHSRRPRHPRHRIRLGAHAGSRKSRQRPRTSASSYQRQARRSTAPSRQIVRRPLTRSAGRTSARARSAPAATRTTAPCRDTPSA